MEQQITATQARLAPAAESDIAKVLVSLRSAGMGLPTGMKPEDVTTVYSYALSGLSTDALNIAAKKLIRGEYPIERKAFIPTPPELAAIVRAESRVISDDLVRLKDTAESMRGPEKPKVDEAAKARIREKLAQFRADHAAQKAASKTPVVEEEMTHEQVAYFRKIQDLPDAPEITPEQMRHRNAIASRIEKAELPKESAA